MPQEIIGFIGVGLMGHGMAKNLVEKGFDLTIMGHRNRAPVESLVGRGAKEARTPAEVAAASSIVHLCVTGSAQVEALCSGPDGLMAGAKPGSIIVDCSTSDPVSTKKLSAAFAERGVAFIDAPLSRTPKEAEAGTLDTMVGADEATFARVKPVFEAWAAKIVHVGPVGAGHTMKLINNFVAMGYGALYAEALTLAAKAGLTPQTVDGVLRGSRMDCGFYQTFMRWVLERDENAHKFTLVNGFKDMRYLENLADSVGLANPMGNAVKNAFAVAVGTGQGEKYVPMLSDVVAGLNGTKLA
ncbi:MAG TPA: NAD(P)-dependent oxidoreductase [Beijerinckiaceae bacterium]|jgi:3-hydroxyisobutyrate dehydrogenase-like beta-hydroxyacid dehydrogenase